MSRKKRRTHKADSYSSHHILFARTEWNKGFKQMLRREFVYQIPDEVHRQLHQTVGRVPPLDEDEARFLWQRYKELGHDLNIFEAFEWLMKNSPNSSFAMAIMAQYGFLRNFMG